VRDAPRPVRTEHRRRAGGDARQPLEEHGRTEPGALDELDKPKEAICFRDRYNYALASSGFPHEQAFRADKSYAETVMRLLECADLCAAVARTHG
jgi:hypothetical protein